MTKVFFRASIFAILLVSIFSLNSQGSFALIADSDSHKPAPTNNNNYRTIYRYWNGKYHYFTVNPREGILNSSSWRSEGEMGKVLSTLPESLVKDKTIDELYAYENRETGNRKFVTKTEQKEFERTEGNDWYYRGRIGYISKVKTALFSLKVYEYQNTDDYLYTGRADELKKLGNSNYGWENRTAIGYFIDVNATGGTPQTPTPTPEQPDNDEKQCNEVCIYRYWNLQKGLHYYFTNLQFSNSSGDNRFEGVLGEISNSTTKDTDRYMLPLYQYRNDKYGNFRFSTKKVDLEGWSYYKQFGHISRIKKGEYQQPIYEYVNTNDYLYTNNYNELQEGAHGWVRTKILGFAKPH